MTMTTYLFLQFVIVAWESEWVSVYVWKPCLLVLYYIIYIATTQNIHDCKMSQFTLMPTTFLKLNLSPVFINKGCFHDTSYVFELIILTCLTSYFSIMLWTQLSSVANKISTQYKHWPKKCDTYNFSLYSRAAVNTFLCQVLFGQVFSSFAVGGLYTLLKSRFVLKCRSC